MKVTFSLSSANALNLVLSKMRPLVKAYSWGKCTLDDRCDYIGCLLYQTDLMYKTLKFMLYHQYSFYCYRSSKPHSFWFIN